MDEGRGIYSVAMFHKKTGQAARRLPCFLPFTSAKRVAAPNNGVAMPTSPRSAKRCHSEFVGADDSVRPHALARESVPSKRGTDCRVAALLAMTARRCRADGTPSPTGGAMWTPSPTERRRGVPYRRRSQDMLATARPPMRTVTAPSFSYRTLRISDGRDMCSPCRNTFSSPGFTSPRR